MFTGLGLDGPGRRGVVEDGRSDARVQADVAAQVEAVGDVVEVPLELLLPGEHLGPLPLLLELLGEAERVLEARYVAAGTRVAVPVPRPADTATRFEDDRREPAFTEVVQGVETRHPGADNDHIDIDIDRGRGTSLGHAAPRAMSVIQCSVVVLVTAKTLT